MVRRVVTGEDKSGNEHISADEELPLLTLGGGMRFARLWGSDAAPEFPLDGALPDTANLMPGPGGYRFSLMRIEPQAAEVRVDIDPSVREMYAKAGIDDAAAGEAPGMHRTDTVDLGVVVSGVIDMELECGEVVRMKAGDVFVQNGTNHKWSNSGDTACEVVVAIIGGHARSKD